MIDDTEPTLEPSSAPSLYEHLRRPLFVLGVLFLFVIMFGKVVPYLIFPHWHDAPGKNSAAVGKPVAAANAPANDSANIDGDVRQRVSQLEAKVKALEDVIAASPKPVAGNVPVPSAAAGGTADKDRVSHLEESLDQQQAAIQAMEAQLSDVQTHQAHQLSALSALAPLKDAIMRGDAFGSELAALTPLGQDNLKAQEALKQLAPYAQKGVGTLAALQSEFSAVIPKALRAQSQQGMLASELHALIRIRKVGEPQGNGDEAVIARAETDMDRDTVEAALKELAALSAPAAAVMADWRAKAEAFVQARALVSALQVALATPPVADPASAESASVPESSAESAHESPAASAHESPAPPAESAAPTPNSASGKP